MIDDDDYGAVGGMRIGRGNRSTRRKPAPVPLCPPQMPHDLTWDYLIPSALTLFIAVLNTLFCPGMTALHKINIVDENRTYQSWWTEDYFLICNKGSAGCIVCNENVCV
jgi:hypothetical protein